MRRSPSFPGATPPRPPWRWATAGALLGLLATLLLYAPAVWLAHLVEAASGGQVQLSDARGTVWQGSAQLVLTGGQGSRDSAALPGRLRWQIRPTLTALQVDVAADCCTTAPVGLRLTPRWRGASLQVSDSQSRWPTALLVGLGTPWNTLQIEGQLAFATRNLSVEWSAGQVSLAGHAEWTATDMSSRLSPLKPMGSYRIMLTGGRMPQLDVATTEGRLHLSGSGSWVGSRLRFRGEARAAPESEAALSSLLNIIGRRQGERAIISIG